MAKAKKQSSTGNSGPAKKTTAKKSEPAKKEQAPLVPPIDTNLAAAAAAKMVANRDLLNTAPSGEKRESSAFKQLKEGLNKPAVTGPSQFLQNSAPQKKLNLPFGGRKQVGGHNQTFGADVNRAGVPRRTGGG